MSTSEDEFVLAHVGIRWSSLTMNIDETKIALHHFAGIPRLVEEFVEGLSSFCRQDFTNIADCPFDVPIRRDYPEKARRLPLSRQAHRRRGRMTTAILITLHAARYTLRHPRARVGLRGHQ
jgi:hypothetical protein